jgi:hypothetical protein
MEDTLSSSRCSSASFSTDLKRNDAVLNWSLNDEESWNRHLKVSGSMEIRFAAAKCWLSNCGYSNPPLRAVLIAVLAGVGLSSKLDFYNFRTLISLSYEMSETISSNVTSMVYTRITTASLSPSLSLSRNKDLFLWNSLRLSCTLEDYSTLRRN